MALQRLIKQDFEKIQRILDAQIRATAEKLLLELYDLIKTKAGANPDNFRSCSQILELNLKDALGGTSLKESDLHVFQYATGTYRLMLAGP